MTDSHVAHKRLHVALLKDIAHQAIAFPQMQLVPLTGDHARGILATMLQHRQRIVELLINRLVSYETDYPAHIPSQFIANIRRRLLGVTQQLQDILFKGQQLRGEFGRRPPIAVLRIRSQ